MEIKVYLRNKEKITSTFYRFQEECLNIFNDDLLVTIPFKDIERIVFELDNKKFRKYFKTVEAMDNWIYTHRYRIKVLNKRMGKNKMYHLTYEKLI